MLRAAPKAPPSDPAAQLPYLVDIVDTVGHLGVFLPDIQVEMAAKGGRGEGLVTERALLVLHPFAGADFAGATARFARASVLFGHGGG